MYGFGRRVLMVMLALGIVLSGFVTAFAEEASPGIFSNEVTSALEKNAKDLKDGDKVSILDNSFTFVESDDVLTTKYKVGETGTLFVLSYQSKKKGRGALDNVSLVFVGTTSGFEYCIKMQLPQKKKETPTYSIIKREPQQEEEEAITEMALTKKQADQLAKGAVANTDSFEAILNEVKEQNSSIFSENAIEKLGKKENDQPSEVTLDNGDVYTLLEVYERGITWRLGNLNATLFYSMNGKKIGKVNSVSLSDINHETKTVNFLAMEQGEYRIIKNDIGIFTSEAYPITEEQALEIEHSLKKDPASFNDYFYRERAKAPSYLSEETFEFLKKATVEAKEGEKINVSGFQEPLSFYTQTDKATMFKVNGKGLYLGYTYTDDETLQCAEVYHVVSNKKEQVIRKISKTYVQDGVPIYSLIRIDLMLPAEEGLTSYEITEDQFYGAVQLFMVQFNSFDWVYEALSGNEQ